MSMFCFQCEETESGTGCQMSGVCGKEDTTSNLHDELTGELIGLARATRGTTPTESTHKIVADSLFFTGTNVNFDDPAIARQIEAVKNEKNRLGTMGEPYDMSVIWHANEDIRSLQTLLLLGMRGMAAYAHHARTLGKTDDTVNNFFYKGLNALGENTSADDLLALVLELGTVNLRCMEILEEGNVGTYGKPVPTPVSNTVEPGPFIVVSGHDLHDLKLLLDQTQGKGINIYTHSEMLPAHGYPELKKYPHLKNNFGTAWWNQQKEFIDIPAPILFTSNCIMPVKANYADRVFTTSTVGYPDMVHIGDDKDFTPVIEKALQLGGYSQPTTLAGTNGGSTMTTGFGKDTILSVAGTVIEAVKAGAIKHFFLVGGCDGSNPERSYYTDFVKQAPADTVILTLACGKFRFNDLDIGEIGGLPRIMDMGQCNDAYGAIQVAVALANAFECGVNELPLTLVLSWYEQKAVCILLTLLALGIKNIYLGPTLPAFVSPNILNVLVENYNLTPTSTPEADLKKILG